MSDNFKTFFRPYWEMHGQKIAATIGAMVSAAVIAAGVWLFGSSPENSTPPTVPTKAVITDK